MELLLLVLKKLIVREMRAIDFAVGKWLQLNFVRFLRYFPFFFFRFFVVIYISTIFPLVAVTFGLFEIFFHLFHSFWLIRYFPLITPVVVGLSHKSPFQLNSSTTLIATLGTLFSLLHIYRSIVVGSLEIYRYIFVDYQWLLLLLLLLWQYCCDCPLSKAMCVFFT